MYARCEGSGVCMPYMHIATIEVFIFCDTLLSQNLVESHNYIKIFVESKFCGLPYTQKQKLLWLHKKDTLATRL